jgi:rubrerythrin
MSERPLPRGETVPPEGESDEPQLDEEAEAEEHDELDEQARREGEEEDDLVGAHRLYIRAVLEHFGADAPVWPCPTCESRGYTLAALQSDPSVHRCPACLGLGETATGSLVEGPDEEAVSDLPRRGLR